MIYKNVLDAKAELFSLSEIAFNGEEVILGENGKPLIKLTILSPQQIERKPGRLAGKIKISEDFDDSSDEIEKLFGMNNY